MRVAAALLFVCSLLLTAQSAGAADGDDTPDTRRQAALRYQQVLPMKDLMSDMFQNMGDMTQGSEAMLPPEKREEAKRIRQQMQENFLSRIDFVALEKASVEAMVSTFTTAEITALTNFYASKEGRSVMKKLPSYMKALMPVMQQEMMKSMPPMPGGGVPGRAPAPATPRG